MSAGYPILAPKEFSLFEPEEYHEYVHSLYREPVRKISVKSTAEVTVRLNAKGTPVLRIKREPKWLTYAEVGGLAREIGWTLQAMLANMVKKKIGLKIKPDN